MKRVFKKNRDIKHDKSLNELRVIMGSAELNYNQLNCLRGGDEDEEMELNLNSSNTASTTSTSTSNTTSS